MTANHAPRFEYRVWGTALDDIETRIRAEADSEHRKETAEVYLVPHRFAGANPKVRAESLDVKVLLDSLDGFERWTPDLRGTFPLGVAWLRDRFFPAIRLSPPPIDHGEYSLDEFLDRVIANAEGISAVPVSKSREFFTVHGCIAEIATVDVAGVGVQTIAIESSDLDELRAARRTTGIGALPNMSYAKAIPQLLDWKIEAPPKREAAPNG